MQRLWSVATALMLSVATQAVAQSFPSRPIRLVVTTPAGVGPDYFVRLYAERLTPALGVPVIVENKPSSTGFIAAEFVARAPADGYTVLLATAQAFTINPVIYTKLPYDPVADFEPLTLNAEFSIVLVTHPSVPARTAGELVEWVKQSGGRVPYASYGAGTPSHFSGEAFNRAAGLQMLHVPYKGSPGQIQDLLGGEVKVGYTVWAASQKLAEAGKLRAIAVTSDERRATLPSVPTMREAGFPDVIAGGWYGFFVRKGTPDEVAGRLTREFVAVSQIPEMKAKLFEQAIDPFLMVGPPVRNYLRDETERWRRIAREANFKPE